MPPGTLLKNGRVLSMDPGIGDLDRGDVLIDGERIVAVEAKVDAPQAEVIDATDMIVPPGFVDTHRHTWQGALRNILPDGDLEDYSYRICEDYARLFRTEDAYAGNLIGALSALDSGITTMLDWCHIVMTP